MTINDAKQAQTTLETTIADALNAFSAKTGLTVNNLQVDNVIRVQSPTRYVVTTEVRL